MHTTIDFMEALTAWIAMTLYFFKHLILKQKPPFSQVWIQTFTKSIPDNIHCASFNIAIQL
jgi:hypothetical protein